MTQNILIIDDNPMHRELIKINIISNMPHIKIFEGNNPSEALDLLLEHDFDLILVDYNMPEMNGLEFLEKTEKTRGGVPVIMITGEGNEEIAAQAFKLGVTDYVVKSMDLPLKITKIVRDTLLNPTKNHQTSASLNSVEGGIRLIEEYQRNLDNRSDGNKDEEAVIIEFDSVSDFNNFSHWVTKQLTVKIKKVGFVGNKYAVLITIRPTSYSRII